MAGRLSKVKAMLIKGRCLNYACDVKLSCRLYDENPTTEEKKQYLAISMQFCPYFVDKDPVVAREEEPDRPFIESY